MSGGRSHTRRLACSTALRRALKPQGISLEKPGPRSRSGQPLCPPSANARARSRCSGHFCAGACGEGGCGDWNGVGGSVVPGPGVAAGGVVLTGGADAGAPDAVVPVDDAEDTESPVPERGAPVPESEPCAHAKPDIVSIAARRLHFRGDRMPVISCRVFMWSPGFSELR